MNNEKVVLWAVFACTSMIAQAIKFQGSIGTPSAEDAGKDANKLLNLLEDRMRYGRL
jgi:hypothetical protein